MLSMAKNGSLADAEFPLLALLISGGHTELVVSHEFMRYKIVGQTRDDDRSCDPAREPGGEVLASQVDDDNSRPPCRLRRDNRFSDARERISAPTPRQLCGVPDGRLGTRRDSPDRILEVSWRPCRSTRIGGTRNRWRPADDRFARYEAVERQPKLRHECSPCETGGARHQNMRPRVLGR